MADRTIPSLATDPATLIHSKIVAEGLTFDDVLLIPRHSTMLPGDADTSTRLTRGIRLNVVMDLYSIHLIKKLVRDGLAYTIATSNVIREEIEAGQLAAARIVSPSLSQGFFLSITSTRPPSAAVRAVADALRAISSARPIR